MKYYVEDKEHLDKMQKIFSLILRKSEGIKYQDVEEALEKTTNQISHYCRKLLKYDFVVIICKSHHKIVQAKKYAVEYQQLLFPFPINRESLRFDPPPQANIYRELQFFPNLWLNLSDVNGKRQQDILSSMQKIEEVKSFPRLFEMLLKDGSISKIAERLGKIFTYRYKVKDHIRKWPYFQELQLEIQTYQGTTMIEFSKETLQDLNNLLRNKGFMDQTLNNDEIIKLINDMEDNDKANTKRKTQLSRTKMNRYATICNFIKNVRMTTIKDLKCIIFDSEKEEHFGMIDTRTIQKYLVILEKIGFCKTCTVNARVVQKECQRVIITHFSIDDDDEELFRFKRELADFKEQKFDIKVEKPLKVKNTSTLKSIKKRQKHLNKINQQIVREELFQSDEEIKQEPQVETLDKRSRDIIILKQKIQTIFEKVTDQLLRYSFQKLRPKYDLEVVNEVFSNKKKINILNYLLGLEYKIQKKVKPQNYNQNYDEWEHDTLQQVGKMNQIGELSSSQFDYELCMKHQKDIYQKQQLIQNTEHCKNYLLRFPNITLKKLINTFPFINHYIMMKKLTQDGSIKILLNNIEVSVETGFEYVDSKIKITEQYLKYFI
ncbi:hypothetical protein pb186bvf_007922 [Paramecium bursaria]